MVVSPSPPDDARFASASFLLFVAADDPLAHAVARRLIIALQDDPMVRRIRVLSDDAELPSEGVAPEIVIRIRDAELDRDTLLGTGTLRACVRVVMSDKLAVSSGHRGSPRPMLPNVEFQVELETRAVVESIGFATPSAQLEAVANTATNAIVRQLRDLLFDARDRQPALPALPDAFWPEFRPVDGSSLPLAHLDGLRRLATWRGMLLHNESWWRGEVRDSWDATRTALVAAAEANGYRVQDGDESMPTVLTDGGREIHVFLDQWPEVLGGQSWTGIPPCDRPAVGSTVFVRYREYADAESVARAVDSTLAQDATLELMLSFASSWSADQQRVALERLARRDDLDVDGPRWRALLRASCGDREAAAEDLRAAALQARLSLRRSDPLQRVERTATELGIALDTGLPTAEPLAAAGVRALGAPGESFEGEVREGLPLAWFCVVEDRPLLCVSGLVRDETGTWTGAFRMDSGTSRSAVSRMYQDAVSFPVDGDSEIRVELLDPPGGGRCRVRVSWRVADRVR
ncbi:MAG: hypothetical protein IPM29_22850 [Planctomycetes bacterium]|nr:hypothetical protein [Planctomycetota bacterium]